MLKGELKSVTMHLFGEISGIKDRVFPARVDVLCVPPYRRFHQGRDRQR